METTYPDLAKKTGSLNAHRSGEPLKIIAGKGETVPGFEESLRLFSKGTKALIIVPSKLAYGKQGKKDVPPYTPLIFEMEIAEIQKAKPEDKYQHHT